MNDSKIARTRLTLLIAVAVAGASAAVALSAGSIQRSIDHRAGSSLAFLGATILLQLFALRLPGRGSVGVSAVGIVGTSIALGTGPAMAVGVAAALAQWAHARGLAHRALFDAANFALSAGASGLVFHAIAGLHDSGFVRLVGALAAGLAYTVANHAALCLAIAVSECRSPLEIWRERFRWARFHFLAFGALALLAASADAQLGAVALVAFVLPPLLLTISMRVSLAHWSGAVEAAPAPASV